jgi:hypothetical protein
MARTAASRESKVAKAIAVIVLPVPTFWLATAMIRAWPAAVRDRGVGSMRRSTALRLT